MIPLLRRLLDPAYLYALNTGPLGRWGAVYLLWALMLFLGWVASLWWWVRSRTPRSSADSASNGASAQTSAALTALLCAAGLLAVILRLVAPFFTGLRFVQGLSPAARYMLLETWTARVWPLSATLAALLVPALYVLSRLGLPVVQAHINAIVGARAQDDALSRWWTIVLACIHLAGLAWLWHVGGHSLWWAVPSLIGLAALPLLARPRWPRLETLGPMFVAYGSATAYWFVARKLGIDVETYRAFPLPDPWSPWFNVPVVVTASVTLTVLIQVRMLVRQEIRFLCNLLGCLKHRVSTQPPAQRGSPDPRSANDGDLAIPSEQGCRAFSFVLVLLVGLWLAATVIRHRTHGVTASDPYCYVQMAIDLAERGTALHTFPLAGLARDLGLPTWPAVHIGYHPPGLDHRAPTMWSIGWPLLMAPLYWLGGLEVLYWAAPLTSALALVATWFLVNEALCGLTLEAAREAARGTRWTVAALCCALVATSPEGSERILVPMADAAAQLFTVLTLWLLLRGLRARGAAHSALWGALAGICFGAVYFVRHPQFPLGVSALTAAILSIGFVPRQDRESATRGELNELDLRSRQVHDSPPNSGTLTIGRARNWVRGGVLLIAFGLAALMIALPDLAYHQAAYGHWLHSESSEWFLLSTQNIGPSFFGILRHGLLRREEIGYLAPLALWGGWLLWRRRRRAAWVLFSGALAVFLFHLFYAALRPRDLIAIWPVLYLCAAYGFVALWRWAEGRRTALAATALIVGMTFLVARSYRTLALPWREDVITFGHVRADQITEFHRLRALTPEEAVIGSMLNSGAIELHAGRAAVHPTPWTEEELGRWLEGLRAQGRPFYVLDDGEEMPALIERLEARYAVRHVATLGLPYFAIGGGNLPRPAQLYRVETQ